MSIQLYQRYIQMQYNVGRNYHYGCSLSHPAVWFYIDYCELKEMNRWNHERFFPGTGYSWTTWQGSIPPSMTLPTLSTVIRTIGHLFTGMSNHSWNHGRLSTTGTRQAEVIVGVCFLSFLQSGIVKNAFQSFATVQIGRSQNDQSNHSHPIVRNDRNCWENIKVNDMNSIQHAWRYHQMACADMVFANLSLQQSYSFRMEVVLVEAQNRCEYWAETLMGYALLEQVGIEVE